MKITTSTVQQVMWKFILKCLRELYSGDNVDPVKRVRQIDEFLKILEKTEDVE